MPRLLLLAALALAPLALAACASDESQTYEPVVPPEAPGAGTPSAEGAVPPGADHGTAAIAEATAYACDGGGGFTLAPAGGGAVAFTMDGDTRTLQPKPGAQGVYAEGDLEVWVADAGAFVIRGGEFVLNDCAEASEA